MDGAKRNAVIDKAAEMLEKGAKPENRSVMCAIDLLREEWLKVTGLEQPER
jgi:hypothetical protein